MEQSSLPKPFPLFILLVLLLALGVGGIFGGFMLTDDPSGMGLQMPLSALDNTPFPNYFLPGLILLIFNGILPILITYGLILQPEWRWANMLNIYPNRHWAWTFSLYCGIILAVWINVQMFILGPPFSLLQPSYNLVAVAILIFTLWPSVMRYYER